MTNISNYLISHYKGRYRIKSEYDKNTNQFPRKLDGTFEDIDCYIDCYKNIRIFYYGKSILDVYIPSLIRGHNTIKQIYEELGKNVIFNIRENDSEVMFCFKACDMDIMEKYLKPKTCGANISPFSSKNLPKNKAYKIPDSELNTYKQIIGNLEQKQIIELTHTTMNYLKSLIRKNNTWEDIKGDMALKGLSGKNYIHAIGEWDNYVDYLKEKLGV